MGVYLRYDNKGCLLNITRGGIGWSGIGMHMTHLTFVLILIIYLNIQTKARRKAYYTYQVDPYMCN